MRHLNSNIQTYRFLVGSIVLYLGISIAVGDLVSAGTLIMISIICTAGLGGLIWFPCSWLIGFLVIYLFNSIKRKSFSPPANVVVPSTPYQADPIAVVSNDVLAIAEYIEKSRKRGATDSQITKRLKGTGWTEKDVELALTYLSQAPQE